jgi:hypothetical protein
MDKNILVKYLMFGGSFDEIKYSKHKQISISIEDAINEYDYRLGNSITSLDDNQIYTLSGGIDSSLIVTYVDQPFTICFQVDGNKDADYARKFDSEVIIDRGFNNISIKDYLREIQKQWDSPHCFRSDLYDYYVYTRYDKMILGDDPIHIDLNSCIQKRITTPNAFIDSILIFDHRQIEEFDLTPFEYNIEGDMNDVVYLAYDWFTTLSRKLFFKSGHISPYFDNNVLSFYKTLPLKYQVNKKLIRCLAMTRLPQFILSRKKGIPPIGQTTWYINHNDEIKKLVGEYLKPGMPIYDYLNYELVQKHIQDYHKMWLLLNLAIWIEQHE